MNHRVQDMPDQPHTETFDFFEVDEGGTLTLLGAEELICHRQIFTDIEPDRLLSATDLIDAIEGTYPLQAHIERLFETESSARDAHPYICSVLSSSAPESVWPSDNEDSCWQSWIEGLSTEGLVKVRGHIESWLDDDVDWAYVEYFPTTIGPQGEALSYFESVPSTELDVLGIHLVYGDHPSSSYYAAELRSDIEVANTRAAERGLSFRFLAQGCAFEPPPRSPLEVERELLAQRFRPAFGLLPDPVPGVHEQAPARVRQLPPAALLPAHDTALVDEWWARAVRELRCPTEIWVDKAGVRHIRVVGGAIFSVDPAGDVRAWMWQSSLAGQHQLLPIYDVSVGPCPRGWIWSHRWKLGLQVEIRDRAERRGVALTEQLVVQYADWLVGRFRVETEASFNLAHLRMKVGRTLVLDRLSLQAARQSRVRRDLDHVELTTYNRVLKHRTALRRLYRDAPRLLGLFALLVDLEGFRALGEPVERLKVFLRAQGLSERGWKVIQGCGPGLLKPLTILKNADAGQAIAYLKMIDGLGWTREPDIEFMSRLLDALAIFLEPNGLPYPPLTFAPRTMQRIVGWFEAGDAAVRAEILEHLALVARWLVAEGIEKTGTLSRHPGWRTIVNRAMTWDRRSEVARRTPEKWPGPASWAVPGSVQVNYLSVRFISTALDLYDEGHALRHCAFDYLDECQEGPVLMVSIRRECTGKRVATAMYRLRDNGWVLDQVKGFTNRDPSDKAEVAAMVIEDMLNHGHGVGGMIQVARGSLA